MATTVDSEYIGSDGQDVFFSRDMRFQYVLFFDGAPEIVSQAQNQEGIFIRWNHVVSEMLSLEQCLSMFAVH